MVGSTFLRSGWSIVRSASLAKGGTSKKRPFLTWSNKVSPRTFQTALVNIFPVTYMVSNQILMNRSGRDSLWI
jgi:hypothetical protein